jgi:hypothetical protein
LGIKTMLVKNSGLLSKRRDDHLLARGNVSNDDFLSLLRAGKISRNHAEGNDQQAATKTANLQDGRRHHLLAGTFEESAVI